MGSVRLNDVRLDHSAKSLSGMLQSEAFMLFCLANTRNTCSTLNVQLVKFFFEFPSSCHHWKAGSFLVSTSGSRISDLRSLEVVLNRSHVPPCIGRWCNLPTLQHPTPSIPQFIGVAPVHSLVMLVHVAVACSSIGIKPRGVERPQALLQRLRSTTSGEPSPIYHVVCPCGLQQTLST